MGKKQVLDLDLRVLIRRYLSYIEVERNYSKFTIRNYTHYLGMFRKWFEKHYEQEYIEKLTSEMVRRYRLFLARFEGKDGKRLSPTTQSYYIISLRAFLKYCAKKGIKSLSPEKAIMDLFLQFWTKVISQVVLVFKSWQCHCQSTQATALLSGRIRFHLIN